VASWELRVSRIGDSNGIAYDTIRHHGNGTGLHGFPLTAAPLMTHAYSVQKSTTYSEAVAAIMPWLRACLFGC
jgi:hypothetical protein